MVMLLFYIDTRYQQCTEEGAPYEWFQDDENVS